MPNEFDAIVIGTGAGGGTLALHLAQAGKNILILERGPFMPQEKLNWDTSAVFLDNRYHTKETWQDKAGNPPVSYTHLDVYKRQGFQAMRRMVFLGLSASRACA